MKESENIKVFLDWLRAINQNYHMALEDEADANNEQQDILHSIELEHNGYRKNARLATALKETRRNRRDAKNRIERLVPVVEWIERNQPVIKGLEKLLGEVRKTEKIVEGRNYTYRTDIVARTLGASRKETLEDETE